MKKTIHEKICEFRKARSLTQEQLGSKLGISGQAVSKWEKGESLPDIMTLPLLCEILGISIDTLLEVPASRQKEHALKAFTEYSKKEDKDHITLFEAFKSRYGETSDDKILKYGSNSLVMYDPQGLGVVINNAEYMQNLLNCDIQALSNELTFFSNSKVLIILKSLSVDKAITRDELIEITTLSEADLTDILFSLMGKRICTCDYDQTSKYGYLFCVESYKIILMLLTFFQSNSSGLTWFSHH